MEGQESISVEPVESVSTEGTLLQTDASKPEIPGKFLVDGQPNYDALTKAYVEMEKKMGSKMPVSNSSEYDFQFQAPDQWDMNEFDSFKNQAKELGLSKEQFNTAMSLYEQNMQAAIDKYSYTPEKAQNQLQEIWGNDYDTNMKSAQAALKAFVPADFDLSGIGNDPKAIQILSIIGKNLKEDNAPSAVNTGVGSGMSKLQIEEMMARPDYFTNREVQKIVGNWYSENYK